MSNAADNQPTPKRPISHWLLVVVLALNFLVFTTVVVKAFWNRWVDKPFDQPTHGGLLVLGSVAFAVILIGGRRSSAYYFVIAVLALFAAAELHSSYVWLSYWALTAGDRGTFMERRIEVHLIHAILIFIFWRYAFGSASRRYYGFWSKSAPRSRCAKLPSSPSAGAHLHKNVE